MLCVLILYISGGIYSLSFKGLGLYFQIKNEIWEKYSKVFFKANSYMVDPVHTKYYLQYLLIELYNAS